VLASFSLSPLQLLLPLPLPWCHYDAAAGAIAVALAVGGRSEAIGTTAIVVVTIAAPHDGRRDLAIGSGVPHMAPR